MSGRHVRFSLVTTAWNPSGYDEAWTQLAAAGKDLHGEVAFLERLHGRYPDVTGPILDAGCGTGRVAIELARSGHQTEGTDIDADMLGHAQAKAPHIRWHLGNLATVDLARRFGVVMMAGNVILFVEAEDRPAAIANVARHVEPGGLVVAGFQLARGDGRRVPVADWDAWTSSAGLDLLERWATWDDDPWVSTSDYVVSVHQRQS